MNLSNRRRRLSLTLGMGLGAFTALLACHPSAFAQASASYPSKPISLVVGYPPGGSTDLTARIIAPELAKRLGGTVVIENLSGAAGSLGAAKVAYAPADGYTLLLGTTNELVITGLINAKQKYNGSKDFTAIGLVSSQPNVLVTSPKTGVRNTDEFLQMVRKNPGRTSYGSSGIGSSLHMSGETIKREAGVFMVHIPYRGVAPLTSDLIGGSVEFAVFTLSSALPHIRSGKMVALGVTSPTRAGAAADIPSLAEHPTLKKLDVTGWFGVFGPANFPPAVADRLRKALDETMQTPDIRKKLEDAGSTMLAKTGDQSAFMRAEAEKYKAIVQFAKISE